MIESHRTPSFRHRGFTLLDVLVLIFVCVMLLGGTSVMIANARSGGVRLHCASNLRNIGQALLLYSHENRGAYPRTNWNPDNPTPMAYTGALSADPFGPTGPVANDVTAALYLLLRTQDLSPAIFTCFSPKFTAWNFNGMPWGALSASNFPSGLHLAYSLHNPYFAAPLAATMKWDNTLEPDFIVAADMNPGRPELLTVPRNASATKTVRINSRNHYGEGQTILGGDGHAEFVTTPYVGLKQDNIYTYGGAENLGIEGPSTLAQDSVLLPVATFDPVPLRIPTDYRPIIIVCVAVVIAVIAFIAAIRFRSQAAEK